MRELNDLLGRGHELAPWLMDMAIDLALGVVIFVVGRFLSKKFSGWLESRLTKAQVDKAVAGFASSIVYALVFTATVLMALSQIGVETTSFIAILGAAGLAIGLALQGSLSNFASGVLIILFRPFKSGDYIEAGGQAGSVDRIELFSTYLKTPDNRVVIVPNSAISNSPIINYSREKTRRVDLVIGISYDADIRTAKAIMEELVAADERILKDPACTIAVSELGDSSVNFNLRPWVKSEHYWAVRASLLENVKYAFDEKGIGIPYPQMDVHLHRED